MARDRAAAAQAVEAFLANLAYAYEIDRSELEIETVEVVFTDNEGRTSKLSHKSLADISPDIATEAAANAEDFVAEVGKSGPTTKEK